MTQGETEMLGWILWILPLVILGVFVGVSLLVHRWQRLVSQCLAPVMKRLVRNQNALQESFTRLADYSNADPAPFGSRMAKLTAQYLELSERNDNLREEYASLQGETRRFSLHAWRLVVGAPFYWYPWYQLYQASLRLAREVESLEQSQADFQAGIASLLDVHWQVAQRVREVSQQQTQLTGRVEGFAAENFAGEAFQAASERLKASQTALETLPPVLINGDQAQVQTQISKEQIVAAYQLLERLTSEHETLDQDLERWAGQSQQARQAVARLKSGLAQLHSALISPPEAVDFAALETRVDQLEQQAGALEVRLSRPEAEKLLSIGEQAQALAEETQELLVLYTQTRKTQSEFEIRLVDVQSQQKALSGLLAALMKSSKFPLTGTTRTQRLAELAVQLSRFTGLHPVRTPDKLARERDELEQLYKQQLQLQRECRALSEQHQAAVRLYQELDIRDLFQWSERVIPLGQQAVTLGLQNFPRDLNLGSFEQDVGTFQQLIMKELPEGLHQPVKEAEIPTLRANLERAAHEAEALFGRAIAIEEVLREVKAQFQQASQRWQALHTLHQQMSWLANSNPVLETSASKDLDGLARKLEQSKGALSAPEQGTVAAKLAILMDLEESIVYKAQTWLTALTKDIEARRKLIAARIDELSGIAQLDDPVLERIRKLLTKAGLPGGQAERLDLEAIIPRLKAATDLWQEWTAIGQEFEELLYKPLVDAYGNANHERQAAQQALRLANQVAPVDLRWPPTTVSFAEDRQVYTELDERWQILKTEPSRAIWAVRRYTDLAADLRAWRRQVQQKTTYAEQEHARITSLEEAITRLAKTLRQRYRAVDSPAGASAREEAARALAKLEDFRSAWRQKPAHSLEPTYDQLYEELFTLKERLRLAGEAGELPG